MKLSPSGESAMERVHSDALHEQKEMGWITQPRCASHAASSVTATPCHLPLRQNDSARSSRTASGTELTGKEERGSGCAVFGFSRNRSGARPF